MAQGFAQLQEVLGSGLTKGDPTGQALDVIDTLETICQIASLKEMVQEDLDNLLAFFDPMAIHQRLLDPSPQETASHGCLAFI